MTDPNTPLTDEDLSAAIDGEADAELLARIEADPVARARRDELAAAAAHVAELVPPALDDAVVDDLVAAALDEPVAPARPSRSTGTAPWLVAAVVVALAGIGLALVLAGRGAGDDVASQRFDTVGSAIGDDAGAGGTALDEEAAEPATASGAESADAAHGAAPTTTTSPSLNTTSGGEEVLDLGTFASGAELREALAEVFPGAAFSADDGATRSRASDDAVARCAEQLRVTLELADGPQRVGIAVVDGQDVLVYEFATVATDDGSPTTLVAAVGIDACDPIELFER
ncbi:MAG: hypothetical protein KDA97_02475 [Acidimicrobiales bacterium]|nr:hypothetical protein [Acidimicrobiales bacterium]